LIDYIKKQDEDLPNYSTENNSSDIVCFTDTEDDFIIRYLHRKSVFMEKKGIECIFREMFENFPFKRTEQEIKHRAVKLCQNKYEINMWHAITNRFEDTYIQKDVYEYTEFQRILTLLRYYILPINDPNHPISPTISQEPLKKTY
jgi:hypothetical protein